MASTEEHLGASGRSSTHAQVTADPWTDDLGWAAYQYEEWVDSGHIDPSEEVDDSDWVRSTLADDAAFMAGQTVARVAVRGSVAPGEAAALGRDLAEACRECPADQMSVLGAMILEYMLKKGHAS